LLIPVANLKNRNGVDPLQPKTARRVLIEMVDYIKGLTSPFVKVYAKNPVYEQIIVFFRVKFITGTDIGFYLKKLNDEIVHYLTPWAFDEEAEVVFGQKVYASSIINFIEERPYVDFITDFEMGVCKKDCCPPEDPGESGNDDTPAETIGRFTNCNDVETFLSENVEDSGEIVAVPSTARSILVSAPRHIIIPYEAPPVLSPCEQRQLQPAAQGSANAGDAANKVLKAGTAVHKIKTVETKPETKTAETKTIKTNTPKVNKAMPEKKAVVKAVAVKSKAAKKKTTAKKKIVPAKANDVKSKKSDNSG
jgi:hypothetical protein